MPSTKAEPLSKTAEVFKKIRRIEIRTSRLVNELFGGRYLSTFKGRGMEFSEVREYVPGDDIRAIHWTVTARLNHPYIKRYTEERELTILIAMDVSGSLNFGTFGRRKADLAAELVSVLSFSALKNNDKIGLLLFSDKIESFIPPRKSKKHALRMVRDILEFQPGRAKTDIGSALHYLNSVQKKRAVVFLMSDFMDNNFEKELKITRRRHDTIAFVLGDPMEKAWPPIGRLLIEDSETGETALAPAGGASERMKIESETQRRRDNLVQLFARTKTDHVTFQTNGDYVEPLMNFFRERSRRYRR